MMDISLDTIDGLEIIAGDFTIVESTPQHQRQLILNDKGDFKQNPDVCAGAFEYLDDEGFSELIRAISVEFTKDGMDVARIQVLPDGVVASDAFYK